MMTLLRRTKDGHYRAHFEESKKKLKTMWKNVKEIVNVKSISQ